jgi:hypothetical protein
VLARVPAIRLGRRTTDLPGQPSGHAGDNGLARSKRVTSVQPHQYEEPRGTPHHHSHDRGQVLLLPVPRRRCALDVGKALADLPGLADLRRRCRPEADATSETGQISGPGGSPQGCTNWSIKRSPAPTSRAPKRVPRRRTSSDFCLRVVPILRALTVQPRPSARVRESVHACCHLLSHRRI